MIMEAGMKKIKLMTILGTRPELIRLSEIIKLADKHFEHVLVHTGQNYDARLNDIFYDDLNLRRPDYYLDVVGDNLGETLGNIIQKSYEIMQKSSRMLCWYLEIRIAACQPFQRKGFIFLFSTWKQETDALMKIFRKKLTEEL